MGRLALFDDLTLEDRVRMLEVMESSRFSAVTLLFVAWKAILAIVFFETPEGIAVTGYRGEQRSRYLRVLPTDDVEPRRPAAHSARPARASAPGDGT